MPSATPRTAAQSGRSAAKQPACELDRASRVPGALLFPRNDGGERGVLDLSPSQKAPANNPEPRSCEPHDAPRRSRARSATSRRCPRLSGASHPAKAGDPSPPLALPLTRPHAVTGRIEAPLWGFTMRRRTFMKDSNITPGHVRAFPADTSQLYDKRHALELPHQRRAGRRRRHARSRRRGQDCDHAAARRDHRDDEGDKAAAYSITSSVILSRAPVRAHSSPPFPLRGKRRYYRADSLPWLSMQAEFGKAGCDTETISNTCLYNVQP